MTAVKCLNLRAVYRQQEYISLMCLSEADTGGHPSRTGLGSASPCALLLLYLAPEGLDQQRKYGPRMANRMVH